MTTNSPQGPSDLGPADEEALDKLASLQGEWKGFFDLRTGEVNWRAFFEENPELNPPGYDETVAEMETRKQPVGKPNPEKFSLSSAMQMVNETRRVREERAKLHGLPPADAQKQPRTRN
jgi:hypothetical protein